MFTESKKRARLKMQAVVYRKYTRDLQIIILIYGAVGRDANWKFESDLKGEFEQVFDI